MNSISAFDQERPRPGWIVVTASVTLAMCCALSIINSVALVHLSEQSKAPAPSGQVQEIRTHVADLERQLASLRQVSKTGSQTELTEVRQVLEDRLAKLELTQSAEPATTDLQALQDRIGGLEARLRRVTTPPAAPARHAAEAVPAKPPAPPFQILGVELRGGERFLAVAPPNASSLNDIRLLRQGEALGAWSLQSLEDRAAVFRVGGQTPGPAGDPTQRIALP